MTKENKSKGPKWDGISRVSNDLYRKNFNKIFNKKPETKEEIERQKLLEEIADRNGF